MEKINSVESSIGIWSFATSQIPGMGGIIKAKSKEFIVHEILPNGNIIFDGSELGDDLGGIYIHIVLWKSGLDTFSAIRKISKFLKISTDDFGYAGLKDAVAETYQRISIWNINKEQVNAIEIPRIRLFNPIQQKFSVKIGDLLGNFFEITIRNIHDPWSKQEFREFKNHIESKGLLNFYGLQRFGSTRPVLHLVGKFLIFEKYIDAIDTYLGNTCSLENDFISGLRREYREGRSRNDLRRKFPNSFILEKMMLEGLKRGHSPSRIIFSLPKSFLRLAISAYQSYIYNKTLSLLKENNSMFKDNYCIPLPGYQSNKLETQPEIWDQMIEVLDEEKMTLANFKRTHPILRSKGSLRKVLFYPKDFNYFMDKKSKESIKITFSLPKGSYATIVTRELIK